MIDPGQRTVKEHPHAALLKSGSSFLGLQILLMGLFILQALVFLLLTILGFGARGVIGGP
jgi:hypothetical protein